jgi:hypothetical protein
MPIILKELKIISFKAGLNLYSEFEIDKYMLVLDFSWIPMNTKDFDFDRPG